MHRTLGGVTAGALFILPGTICMMAMSYGYVAGGKSNLAEALFYGLKPAVLVIVVQSLVRVGRRFLRSRLMLLLSAAAFVATYLFNLPFAWIVIVAVLAGLLTGLLGIRALLASTRPAGAFGGAEEGLGDERLADHTRPSAVRALRTVALWLALWLVPIAAVVAISGWQSVFSRIAIFTIDQQSVASGPPAFWSTGRLWRRTGLRISRGGMAPTTTSCGRATARRRARRWSRTLIRAGRARIPSTC